VVVRCGTGAPTPCARWTPAGGQVSPPTVKTEPGQSAAAMTPSQLEDLRRQAKGANKWYATGSCPTTAAQLASPSSGPTAGAPVFVEGPCAISINNNSVVNTAAAPGVLVVNNGTVSLNGTSRFYGLIYAVNAQASSAAVISLGGNASIQGSVAVDGNGGVSVGSSRTNIIFDGRGIDLLTTYHGVTIAKNTWRVLPEGQ